MAIQSGTHLGPYEIISAIGAGAWAWRKRLVPTGNDGNEVSKRWWAKPSRTTGSHLRPAKAKWAFLAMG